MAVSEYQLISQSQFTVRIVLEVLSQVFNAGKPADVTLNSILKRNPQCGARDRRFISETLFAVLRWWGWLKTFAPTAYKTPRGWDRVMIAAWLLESPNKLPEVAMLWKYHAELSTRQIELILEQDNPLARIRKMMIFFNMDPNRTWDELIPKWSHAEIINVKGGFEGLIEEMQSRPPVWLRPQTDDVETILKELKEAGVEARTFSRYFPAICLESARPNLRLLAPFTDGRVEIQDLASQVIGAVCAPQEGESWWDCCAGAGGKTLQLSAMMNRRGTIMATDIRENKLDDLKKRAQRGQMFNIRTKQWDDNQKPPQVRNGFHGVLVDAPCSCSGTWRRNPDARWTTTKEEVLDLTKLQLRILKAASRGVNPGGVLVYATCSMFKIENETVIRAFLRDHKEFTLEPFVNPLNGKRTNGLLQVWPSDGNCDAMFVARMRRKAKEAQE